MSARRFWTAAGALLALGCGSAAPPRVLSGFSLKEQIAALPRPEAFTLTGIGFRNGRLWLGSNVGVLEVRDDRLVAIRQWHPRHNQVTGPWPDEPGRALWFRDSFDNALYRGDDAGWERVDLPPPDDPGEHPDFYSGLRGASSPRGFWMSTSGGAWRREPGGSTWTSLRPPDDGAVDGLAPLDEGLLAVVHIFRDIERPGVRPGELRLQAVDGPSWRTIAARPSIPGASAVVATPREGFLVTAGEILRFDFKGFQPMTQPGPCEALSRTTKGGLLGSFPGLGLFLYESGTWRRVCALPQDGAHAAFLAEEEGRIAYATSSVLLHPTLVSDPYKRSGTTALWILKGDALVRVPLDE